MSVTEQVTKRGGVVEQLSKLASRIPGGEPVLDRARNRARQAAEIVSAAVVVDPTLLDRDRDRDIEVVAELLRQLHPLARQAAQRLEHSRLTAAAAPAHEFARLGRTNPLAPAELDALSEHLVVVAERIRAAALPDWNTPRRIRERSERLLPSPRFLADLADQLAAAVGPAAALSYPAAAAIRLAALADQLRAVADSGLRRCAGLGCDRGIRNAGTGRPRIYCGPVCRKRASRAAAHVRQPTPR
ncbi:MAG: hypothetical protein ABIQ18_08380 [Umezawaea sp.]